MGIVNINDDSFSGDGSLNPEALKEQCINQINQGADIIDLGAESARTNREAIPISGEIDPLLSINTWRPEVIKHLLESSYSDQIGIINDMSALAYPKTLKLLKESKASLLIMHSVGLPKEDHSNQKWDNIMVSLNSFFTDKIQLAREYGISEERLIIDPGLDFAKNTSDSLKILKNLDQLNKHHCLTLLPLSRKGFIGEALTLEHPADRDAGTIACLPFLDPSQNYIIRVHNVRACWKSLKVLYSINP